METMETFHSLSPESGTYTWLSFSHPRFDGPHFVSNRGFEEFHNGRIVFTILENGRIIESIEKDRTKREL